MNASAFLQQYWPILLVALWFGYKWWNARRVVGLLPQLKASGATLVDVRSPEEFAAGNAPGSVNIPLHDLGSRLAEIPASTPVVVCCASGTRSGMARLMLKKKGYGPVFNIGKWTNLLR
jgi:phage shock protein E